MTENLMVILTVLMLIVAIATLWVDVNRSSKRLAKGGVVG